MKIIVANTAGFCFGVDRAVKMVEEAVLTSDSIVTLGPIIHNKRLVSSLEEKGAYVIDDISQATGKKVVIRSHGVGASVYSELLEKNIPYIDATCPFVSNIHNIVKNTDADIVIIAGDENHPEVEAIRGHCKGKNFVVSNADEFYNLCSLENLSEKYVILVAQTTFNTQKWCELTKLSKEVCTNMKIFDTICSATEKRQKEAYKLSQNCDVVFVVGDRSSSNTLKLFEICNENCKCYLIESGEEIDTSMFKDAKTVGITAGASAPHFIIKEVLQVMSETQREENLSFEEMLEQSFKAVRTNQRVVGVVAAISHGEVHVDIGTKHAGFIPSGEISQDPSAKAEDLFKPGDEVDLIVLKVDDSEGRVMLSKRRFDEMAGQDEIIKAYEEEAVLEGIVTEVIKGGVIVTSAGVRIFVPASQATVSKNDDINLLKGTTVNFKIIEPAKGRRSFVGSIKAVLNAARNELRDKFWEEVSEEKVYSGEVKSLTGYGAFVDLGGVDGMIHISELSWKKIRHPSEVVKVGDIVEVYIKSLDRENKKVSLGYKKAEDNTFEVFKRDFKEGDTVNGKVVSITNFGAFVNIFEDVDGLVHISQISYQRVNSVEEVLKVGDAVTAQITAIDADQQRVSLSIKALLPKEDAAPKGDETPNEDAIDPELASKYIISAE